MKEETAWSIVAVAFAALIGTVLVSWHVAVTRMHADCVAAGKDFVDNDCREAGSVRK